MTPLSSTGSTGRRALPALLFALLLFGCVATAAPSAASTPLERADSGKGARAYPSSTLRSLQWWLDAVVDTEGTTPPEAGDSSPRLAIVTPGIDVDHPDLATLDIQGAVSLGRTGDLVGTAVAGIAAGQGGQTGVVGIWPGMKLRHASSGDGSCQEAAEAIFEVARRPGRVEVILLAYAFGEPSCPRHLAATQYAISRGLLVVAPTGDSNSTVPGAGGPAADPHVVGVGAVDETLELTDFSTVGPTVDLVAPGDRVFAPFLGGSDGDEVARTYEYLDGTVYSAAIVAAAASLVAELRGRLWRSQIEAVLAAGSSDLDPAGRDEDFGSGLVQLEGALAAEAPIADKLEPNDDIGWIDGRLLSNGTKSIRARPLWPYPGRKVRRLQATLSPGDPADVYRIRVPARTKFVIGVAQAEGDVAIDVRKQGPARTIANAKGRFGASDRRAPRTEGLAIRNGSSKPRFVYLVVRLSRRSTSDSARYQVTVPVRRSSLGRG